MPPTSQSLAEEGACITSFKLVQQGLFQEDGIRELLMAPGSWWPLSSLFYPRVAFSMLLLLGARAVRHSMCA